MAWTDGDLKIFAAGLAIGGKWNGTVSPIPVPVADPPPGVYRNPINVTVSVPPGLEDTPAHLYYALTWGNSLQEHKLQEAEELEISVVVTGETTIRACTFLNGIFSVLRVFTWEIMANVFTDTISSALYPAYVLSDSLTTAANVEEEENFEEVITDSLYPEYLLEESIDTTNPTANE
jgi:hypothetical protein